MLRHHVRIVALIVVAISLSVPLYFVPNMMGDSFVRASLDASFLSTYSNSFEGGGGLIFRVLSHGNSLNVSGVQFSIHVSNSYFMPVVLSYTGPDSTIFVYNSTVPLPGDAKFQGNLVWEATGAYGGEEDNTRYVSASDLAEHVTSIPTGSLILPNSDMTWNGTDTRSFGSPIVTPGFYYVYAMAFGKSTAYTLLQVTA